MLASDICHHMLASDICHHMLTSQMLLKVSKETESTGCEIWVVGRWCKTSDYQVTRQTDRTRLEILRQ